jgi:3-isopropylmalate/(R)-2-methylmalate dehydratase small subunit
MTTVTPVRDVISGTAIAMNGNDIDTDRIIPAKYLKSLTFDKLGAHAFEVDRANVADGEVHPFDDPVHAGASVLLVASNFGCGSSREHAPQALNRWGIKAIAGISFGEIFRGNAATIGLPCVTMSEADSARARAVVGADPTLEVTLDLARKELRAGDHRWPVDINESLRARFISGTWDSLTTLLAGAEQVRQKAATLPYLNGFAV